MKTAIVFIATFLCVFILNAQPPQAFKYQAVVRDNTGEILQNKALAIPFQVLITMMKLLK